MKPTAEDTTRLIGALRAIAGRPHVLTGEAETRRFRSGYRTGEGPVIAVVRPGSLVEQWRILQACAAADVSIILQASNTGLTGGSTPDGADYPGGVVLVSTTRIAGVHVIDEGRQVVCLPGATLYEVERTLKPFAREPHSIIGSSCIGASVLGGICNNSGGSLVQRGPAFTQLALYAAIRSDGTVELVNHLGIAIAGAPEEILASVERGDFDPAAIAHDPARWAHDRAYADHVRQIDEDTPARFNADPRCLFEGSGSAGKVVLFAVRLDTFARQEGVATFYVGTNDPMQLTHLRRAILGGFESLPIAGEYIHRTAFDIAAVYGKDTFLAIQRLGTDRLPALFALKAKVDTLVGKLRIFGDHVSDHAMQIASKFFPHHLPKRMRDYRDRFEHHLMLKMPAAALDQTRALLAETFASGDGAFFECTDEEATKAFLHRFATAGAAIRYREIHRSEVEDIMALDIALPRNERDWLETLPPEIEDGIIHKLYYGHFFCHVFHQDYIVKKGVDPIALEHQMWDLLDTRGAEYPAEHNVGHLYKAKPALADFYRGLDPRNQLNPGIGHTSKQRFWGEKPTGS
jgi:D-lactate dehydrogenase